MTIFYKDKKFNFHRISQNVREFLLKRIQNAPVLIVFVRISLVTKLSTRKH